MPPTVPYLPLLALDLVIISDPILSLNAILDGRCLLIFFAEFKGLCEL